MISNDNSNTPEQELIKKANEGLENRLNNFKLQKNLKNIYANKKIYKDRLKHEINIINSMDYASYFLIVSDYIRWAKKIQYR